MKILLIIPAYNEEKCILKTYEEIVTYNKKNKTNYEVIVINDGSKDNTKNILEKNKIPHINLIRNLGIGGAVQTGYKYAYQNGYDVAIQYDADGQHDVKYIKNMIEIIEKDEADFVIGSRFIEQDKDDFLSTKARRVGIKLISNAIKIRTGKKIYDTTSGLRASNKKVIKFFSQNYPTEYPEPITNMILLKQGYRIKEIGVKMRYRYAGKSSIRAWKNVYYMINVLLSIFLISYKGGQINE